MRVLILAPDLDLPFKRPGLRKRGVDEPTQALRFWWHRFAHEAQTAFVLAGHTARVLTLPAWEITPDLVRAYAPDLALVPHRQRADFPCGVPCLFYMQMYARWLFTCDPQGWGAGASVYPVDDRSGDPQSDAYDTLAQQVIRESKFEQPASECPDLPDEYIFFPCQIPHDENVVQHSDVKEAELVGRLAEWANARGVDVVFKPHPANPQSMKPLKQAAPPSGRVHWINANVHDLILRSTAVYTINSGVGFEAILHGKPVATFGHCEYDAVTYHGSDHTLDNLWTAVRPNPCRPASMFTTHGYRRFVDWFVRRYAVDLSDTARLSGRMTRLVQQGEALAAEKRAA